MKRFLFTLVSVLFLGPSAFADFSPTRLLLINGLHIAAYESSGTRGPGVLLIHGNTSSAQSFAKVLSSPFARKHRVVAIDLPGYGQSDNAPSYNVALFATTIATAAQLLHVDSGVLVGWSLGGDLVLQASTLLPQVKGVFVFGTAPVGYAPDLPPPFLSPQESYAGAAVQYGFVPNLTPAQISEYVTAFFRPNYAPIPSFFFDAGLRTDPLTRLAVALAGSGQDPTFQDEVALVKNMQVPLAIVHAEHDAFTRYAFLTSLAPQIPTLWKNKIIVVKKSGHAIHWEKTERLTALLRQFIQQL